MKVRQWIWSVYSIKLRRTDKNTGMPRGWQERGVIMTKIDIISGFLGAGKTTFIKKLLKEAIAGEKVVLIENEFGEIGIDGGFLKDSGIEIREMNSGCICCSLVGDFGRSLNEVLTKYTPDRVIIEPSGVGKLSDVMKAVCDVAGEIDVVLNGSVTVVDAQKCKMYMKNFGEFFNNQIESAGTIVLSRTDVADADKVAKAVELIRENETIFLDISTTNIRIAELLVKKAVMALFFKHLKISGYGFLRMHQNTRIGLVTK